MDFKIDDNIPVTHRKPKGNFIKDYPTDKLKIGQSFLIEIHDLSTDKSQSPAYSGLAQAIGRYNRDHKDNDFVLTYRVRRIKKHGEDGIRIWKIAKEKTV